MDLGAMLLPSGLDRRVDSLLTPGSTVSILPIREYEEKTRLEEEFASSIGLLGARKKTETRRMKADYLAPPTGIFQQRTFSTTPSRPVEAPSRVGGVPDWSAYQSSGKGENTRTLSYFMVGSLGVLAASGAKSTVSDILSNMAASADVLALAKIEVEMGSIPEGMSSISKAGILQLTL
jgi:hypothetical protein